MKKQRTAERYNYRESKYESYQEDVFDYLHFKLGYEYVFNSSFYIGAGIQLNDRREVDADVEIIEGYVKNKIALNVATLSFVEVGYYLFKDWFMPIKFSLAPVLYKSEIEYFENVLDYSTNAFRTFALEYSIRLMPVFGSSFKIGPIAGISLTQPFGDFEIKETLADEFENQILQVDQPTIVNYNLGFGIQF